MKYQLPAILSCAALLLWPLRAPAWETAVIDNGMTNPQVWTSIYLTQDVVPMVSGSTVLGVAGNEHANLVDISLQQIGAAPMIGRSSKRMPVVIDLNASHFRPVLRQLGTRPGDGARSLFLEQRVLPTVPQWAGVPDFSYSIDDWINKNHYCPPRPQMDDWCHVYFGGWLAGFNSSHFGSQATGSYELLHRTALNLSARAKLLRTRVETYGTDIGENWPEDRIVHRDKVEEAELMALYYESSAQHFLQDRWSTGHMWARFSGPDYDQSPFRDSKILSTEAGSVSGLIHGAEAISGQPDAVSSPYFPDYEGSGALPPLELASFRMGADGPLAKGIGDDRLEDLFDGAFGMEYTGRNNIDTSIPVAGQRAMMMACLNASWADVIRGLGSDTKSGGFGILGIGLNADYRAPFRPGHTCTDMWLTNHSIYLGWNNDNLSSPGAMARILVNAGLNNAIPFGQVVTAKFRTSWVAITVAAKWYNWSDPDGTQLARGVEMPDFGNAKPGNNYGPPGYLKTTELSDLPEQAANGIDKQAVFGFFNKARADYFCRGLADRLKPLRGAAGPKDRQVCRYLAERSWSGTDERYDGINMERRVGPNGGPAHAICQMFDGAAKIDLSSYDEDTPQWLHPGYTKIRTAAQSKQSPYAMAGDDLSSQSIENWCDQVPVIDLLSDAELMHDDVVAVQKSSDREIQVTGLNLGDATGKIALTDTNGKSLLAPEITGWSQKRIRFSLAKDARPPDEDTLISVTRADGVKSVGRFVLRRDPRRPKVVSVLFTHDGDTHYRDDGEVDKPSVFRLLAEGVMDVQIDFDTPMARQPVNGVAERIQLGILAVEGAWSNDTRWKGKVTIPQGKSLRGIIPLSIQAATRDGDWIDSDPDEAGNQPDVSRRMVADQLPVFVASLQARGDGGVFYAASWSRDPRLEEARNLLAADFKEPPRVFQVGTAKALPTSGRASFRLIVSAPLDDAPKMTVGNTDVVLKGNGTTWLGDVDMAAIAPSGNDLVPVTITLFDVHRRNADADPRTSTLISLPARGAGGNWWVGYESAPGQASTNSGGDDRWHKLGPPPDASLVIVLDGSGSMADNNKMPNAKSGIASALSRIPTSFEVGAIVLSNCGRIDTLPFTRDFNQLKSQLLKAQPSGSTPIAAALARTRVMLETEAHSLSRKWTYLPFTDGQESCGGDVGAETGRLDAAISAHANQNPVVARNDREAPPSQDPEDNLPKVKCQPMSWTRYETKVRDGRMSLDDVSLIEQTYVEQQDAAGRCTLALVTKRYGIYYGAIKGKSLWRVNSRPSSRTRVAVGSSDGADAVEAFRTQSNNKLQGMDTMAGARRKIEAAVQNSLGKG